MIPQSVDNHIPLSIHYWPPSRTVFIQVIEPIIIGPYTLPVTFDSSGLWYGRSSEDRWIRAKGDNKIGNKIESNVLDFLESSLIFTSPSPDCDTTTGSMLFFFFLSFSLSFFLSSRSGSGKCYQIAIFFYFFYFIPKG